MQNGSAKGNANGDANGNANGKHNDSATSHPLENLSDLQTARLSFSPPIPAVFHGAYNLVEDGVPQLAADAAKLKQMFPKLIEKPAVHLISRKEGPKGGAALRIGIVLSGGQAPGGHNVIAGLLHHLRSFHPNSHLFGFLNGPRGIINGDYKEITEEEMFSFFNQGGFHMICSGRDKIETQQDLTKAAESVRKLELDGLVVTGGDDSNTNAAVLAEFFLEQGVSTAVIGCPKTIDGDLKNAAVAISFGFDTACKVFSELVGNIMLDAASARKYYHFIRLMGRSASHITLECALQTHPQAALISEEVAARRMGLADITKELADMVEKRAEQGRNYGVVLVPEGLIEFVPEVGHLIAELNELLADSEGQPSSESIAPRLSDASRRVFEVLPGMFQQQLLLDRDPHGNVQVSKIETERLLLLLVESELNRRAKAGSYNGKFSGISHFFGYEGRASLPSNFDCTYCYSLGHAAGALLAAKQTGLMVTLSDLNKPALQWGVGGTPLPSIMCIERRKGKDKPVIRKALVELDGAPFKAFTAKRNTWALEDCFRSPGPIQFGGGGVADVATITLALEINNGSPIHIY